MNKKLAIIDDSKYTLKKIVYNLKYRQKFKKFNIDKSFYHLLITRCECKDEEEISNLIKNSKNQEDFSNNIATYLKSKDSNIYASTLLLGNITGKYVFNNFYFHSIKDLNIDAFSKENQELLKDLKSHLSEYVINTNRYKNKFVENIGFSNNFSVKDLSTDVNETKLLEDFEKILNGNEIDDPEEDSQKEIILDYLMKTLGTYSSDDIKNNFNFILYDINNNSNENLDSRRKKYLLYSNLSNNQLMKIDESHVLKQRLQKINKKESEELLSRLNAIENNFYENIAELEDIYSDYEILYRKDLIDNLYVPKNDVTIIEDYKDVRPQLIHQFLRNPKKFRNMEIQKIKEKIISERRNGNDSKDLTEYEQKKLNELIYQVDANLNQYKVNYTTDGKGTSYTGSLIFDTYHSDTSNQISASLLNAEDLLNLPYVGIIGIGFNKETLTPESIALSSNSYKTTNKGINNLEYNEEYEFEEMSSPYSELLSKKDSEIVIHRRGIDFDTKASYILAKINSSNSKQTNEIMEQIEQVRKNEGLKAVIYDTYKIRESFEKSKQEQQEHEEK